MPVVKLKTFLFVLTLSFVLFYCKTNKQSGRNSSPSATEVTAKKEQADFSKSPVLSPSESMARMQLEEGFKIRLVASEPLISTPVAVNFDANGRIWVVEMNGYMPDTLGTGEEVPNGKIVILADKDGDGVMDTRKIFLDSLVLPRAICLIENGILVAESPNLWYYEIVNDKPVSKTLVDAQYAVGGNVEHQPNGLLRALDNWIYNAKATKRYRKRGNKWLIEKTTFRGQWGISQDNHGRLYYNHNSANVLGDYFLPGLGAGNPNQRNVSGYNEKIVASNRVYPARPTPGVNRGYLKGVLNDSLRLVNFTAACGPLVYRGGLFGNDNEPDVFVPEPSANLIKRNRLNKMDQAGNRTMGRQLYTGKEFLASTDERFRPVSLYNGPDGSMYVVDMYRGIIQHKTYLTPYLKEQIGKRDLTEPLNCGRIYKITPTNSNPAQTIIPGDAAQLVSLLSSPNGYLRDKAQQTLIDRRLTSAIPRLQALLEDRSNEIRTIHALWTLEGLGALKSNEVLSLLQQSSWSLRRQAFGAIASVVTADNYLPYLTEFNKMIDRNDSLSLPYIAFTINKIAPFNTIETNKVLARLVKKAPDNRFVADAVIGNLYGKEIAYQQELLKELPDTSLAIHRLLNMAVISAQNAMANPDPEVLAKRFPKGANLYKTICQTCHGTDGNGVQSLAPPLNQSEWVTGNKEKLISIVLFGLTGPVEVNKHLYKAPEINSDMPGIGYDPSMPNEDIAELLSYIRKSWKNNAEVVEKQEVRNIRGKLSKRQKAFTVEELNKM